MKGRVRRNENPLSENEGVISGKLIFKQLNLERESIESALATNKANKAAPTNKPAPTSEVTDFTDFYNAQTAEAFITALRKRCHALTDARIRRNPRVEK